MYVPPYRALLSMIAASAKRPDAKTLAVPEGVFKALLQMALTAADFDETAYLRENPDVAESLRRGGIPGAKFHYVNYGYFEGRPGGVAVDAAWYERQYPDVAQGIRSGRAKVKSAMEHFNVAGAAEGRAPNGALQPAVAAWLKALGA